MNLLKNSTIVIIGVIVSNLLAYLFHFIAGRMLGPEDYGVFGALMALFLLTALPASALGFAISKFTSRFYSENQFRKIVLLRKKIQIDVLIFSAIMLAFVILFSKIIAGFLKINSNIPVIIVGIVLVFALLLPVNRGILQGMKKFRLLSWNMIVEALSRLILLLIFLYLGYGASGAVFAYGFAYFFAYLWIFFHTKEINSPSGLVDKIEVQPVYRFISQVLIVNLIIQSLVNIPSLFIKHFYSSEFTGYWTAALNIARISLFISGAISLVMFPEIAGEKDQHNKKRIFEKAAILVLIVSLCMALLFFAIPQFLIQTLYGRTYLGAVPVLKGMGFAMIFIGLLQLRADYFLARLK